MSSLRGKDWVRFGGLVLLVAIVLSVELRSGQVREFYKELPLQAGIVTGLLLSAVAYFGFDAIRAGITERRWAPLSRLALMWLVAQTTMLIDVVLWLVTAVEPGNARPDEETRRQLVKIKSHDGAAAPADETDLGKLEHEEYRLMIERLMRLPAWRKFADTQLNGAKWRNREGISTYAAAMLTTGESADVLNRLALLNEWLSDIQHSLRNDPQNSTEGVEDWLDWHAEAVSVREDLLIAARGSLPRNGWRSVGH